MSQSSTKQKLQREKIAQFISLTQSSEKHAINFLAQYDWKLDVATDAYYNSLDSTYTTTTTTTSNTHYNSGSGGSSSRQREMSRMTIDKKKLDQIWSIYKGNSICLFVFFNMMI